MVKRAKAAGYRASDEPIEEMTLSGVGNGVQKCRFRLSCPIAVPSRGGTTHLHNLSVPMVEGPEGSKLPGLLGLQSLEMNGAIIDTRRHVLLIPGPGEVTYNLLPGTMEIQMEKAPSGHLVIRIDDYAGYESAKSKGGTPPRSATFLSLDPKTAQKSRRLDVAADRAGRGMRGTTCTPLGPLQGPSRKEIINASNRQRQEREVIESIMETVESEQGTVNYTRAEGRANHSFSV